LENNPSILDSSSASRAFSFLICSVSFLNLSVSASISSVPLKAEISQESRRPQTERQETPLQRGDVEELGFGVSIKPQQSRQSE
jgi:hypothetical protein